MYRIAMTDNASGMSTGAPSASTNTIVTDYPYTPRYRKIGGAGAEQIVGLMDAAGGSVARILATIQTYLPDLRKIPIEADPDGTTPFWANGWLPGLDGMLLYSLVRHRAPKIFLEVGSGNSTKFVRQAIADANLATQIVSIDPHPRASVDRLCDVVIRSPVEELPGAELAKLVATADMLFVDNSHRAFQNSDVTVFFTEMLPALRPGTIYGIHDIVLPDDYSPQWADRFYNEQYMLVAYLLGGAAGDDVLFPGLYATGKNYESIGKLFEGPEFAGVERFSGAFWMARRQTLPSRRLLSRLKRLLLR